MPLKSFQGVIPAFITPFDEKGNYSERCAAQMIDWQISKGIGGYYFLGSNGYGPAMDSRDRMMALESMVKLVNGRVPAVAHIAAVSGKETVEMAKHAQELGCLAVSAVPSYYYKLSSEEMYRYYSEIAEAVSIPLIVYAKTADYAPSVAMFQKLAEIPGVRGVKYTGPSHYMMGRIKDHLGKDFMVYSGYDEMCLSGILSGADAVIGGTYNLYPDLCIRAIDRLKKGDVKGAQEDYLASNAIIEVLFRYGNLQSVMRAAMGFMGIDAGFNPPPFTHISEEAAQSLKKELTELKKKLAIAPIGLFEALD
ncbi:MAG: dihydrodipicolinate synthase family protein [Clostridia bacterium]|nr:dihydrodipicolinate synthase family protein [Clostridia bacterium]